MKPMGKTELSLVREMQANPKGMVAVLVGDGRGERRWRASEALVRRGLARIVSQETSEQKIGKGRKRRVAKVSQRGLELTPKGREVKTEGMMDIERVNQVLTKAILGLQDGEAEALFSLGEAMAVGRTSYNVPAPGQMYKPPSPKAMGIKKVEPLTQKNVRKGMPLGSIWIVTKASPKSVSIALQRDQGKSYSYRWDGMGYGKQGSYLHTDGETRPLGDAGPVEAKVRYPQGTLFFSKGYKWSFVVTGPPVKQSYGGVVYPGRKPKGSKVYQLWVHDGQVRAMSLRGKDDMTLYNAMARIPA